MCFYMDAIIRAFSAVFKIDIPLTCKRIVQNQWSHGYDLEYVSLVVRKPDFGVSDQVPHKPGCTATEDG